MLDRLKQIHAAILAQDLNTWVVHWLLGIVPCVLIGIWSPIAAAIGARIFLIVMAVREGMNYEMHRYEDPHGMRRWTKDGVMDLLGPILNDVIWSAVVYA